MLSDIVEQWNGILVSPMDVYRDMFKLGDGELQKKGEKPGQYKANPIAYFRNSAEERGHSKSDKEKT